MVVETLMRPVLVIRAVKITAFGFVERAIEEKLGWRCVFCMVGLIPDPVEVGDVCEDCGATVCEVLFGS